MFFLEKRNIYHNYHEWAFKHRLSINLWAGILGDSLVSVFLNEELADLLDDVPLQFLAHPWFQHDGASVHCIRQAQ
jgi:hypothetical protein